LLTHPQECALGGVNEVTLELTADETEGFRKLVTEIAPGLTGPSPLTPGPLDTPALLDNPALLDTPALLGEIEVAARWLPPRMARALSHFRGRARRARPSIRPARASNATT